jgi:galactokinase
MSNGTVHAFAPGRIEVAGNHTDHQGGATISAAVDKGISMTLRATDDGHGLIESAGFGTTRIDLSDLAPHTDEAHTTAALARGVIAGLRDADVHVTGFAAQVASDLAPGGGLSSSAAFELALAKGLDALFGSGTLDPDTLAHIAQRAEVEWFSKPCGLQDQTAIAHGGILALDFIDADRPTVTPICFDFAAHGLAVCLVDTGSDHAQATDDFAQLVGDMTACAAAFGATRLCEVADADLLARIPELRRSLGDRAALRALHWVRESHLVRHRIEALRAGDVDAFLRDTRASAASSAQFLQNITPTGSQEQPAMVALALAEAALDGRGAVRIHGGGFGGTLIAFVPADLLDGFTASLDRWLFPGCCQMVEVSQEGVRASWT